MKEAIHNCMTVYEVKIRALAENPLLGPRFQNFIRRWEMNNAPPPEEEKKPEPYVQGFSYCLTEIANYTAVQYPTVRGAGGRVASQRPRKKNISMPTTTKMSCPSCLHLRPPSVVTH